MFNHFNQDPMEQLGKQIEEYVRSSVGVVEAKQNAKELMGMLIHAISLTNEYLLGSSKQGGFLAAAAIASVPIWSPSDASLPGRAKFALLFFTLSIIASLLVHLVHGLRNLKELRETVRGMSPHMHPREIEIQKAKLEQWGSLKTPAWIIGILQMLLLSLGLLLAGWVMVT